MWIVDLLFDDCVVVLACVRAGARVHVQNICNGTCDCSRLKCSYSLELRQFTFFVNTIGCTFSH